MATAHLPHLPHLPQLPHRPHPPHLMLLDARAFIAAGDDALLCALALQLGASEQARLPGFVRARRAREFVLGRLLLRMALVDTLGCQADLIEVHEPAGGGPRISVGELRPEVSLSHGGGWVACAIGQGFALGVDIQTVDAGRDLQALAQSAFSVAERRWLAAQTDVERGFHQLWCGKEALFKYLHNAGLVSGPGLPELHCDDLNAAPQAPPWHIAHRTVAAHTHLALCCPSEATLVTQQISWARFVKKIHLRQQLN